jgi:hypothetical protein
MDYGAAMSKSSEELYKKREKRINDAIGLKEPYRVPIPIMVLFNFFLTRYFGITIPHCHK